MSLVLDRDPPVAVMSSKDRQPPKVVSTGRLKADRQTLDEMYQPPSELFLKFVEDIETSKGSSNTKVEFWYLANFLEIEVCKPFVHKDEKGRNKFTDYEVRPKLC